MEDAAKGQVTRSAADVYQEFFVPSLFQQWAAPVVRTARIAEGDHVLDVACGTGVLAREALAAVGPNGAVTGFDPNEGMLVVAQRTSSDITWTKGTAEQLPYEEASFDAVISQFGLMFFEDRVASLQNMWHVLKPGGRLVVAVWDSLENTPGYLAMTELLRRLFGDQAADALYAPYNLGNSSELMSLFEQAGIQSAQLETQPGEAQFSSLEAWLHTDVKGWTLSDLIDDTQYETLKREAATELARFVNKDGSVAFAAPAHIVCALKP